MDKANARENQADFLADLQSRLPCPQIEFCISVSRNFKADFMF